LKPWTKSALGGLRLAWSPNVKRKRCAILFITLATCWTRQGCVWNVPMCLKTMELYRAICDSVTLGLLLFVPGHGTYRRFRLGDENPRVRKQRRYQLAIALHKPRGPVRSREVFHRFRKDSNDGCFPQTHRSLMIAGRYVGEKRLNHQERRKLARLPLGVLVRIRPSGQNPELGETLNVSPRGLYLHTRARLQPGQELECVLVLPEMLTHAPAPCSWSVAVASSESMRDCRDNSWARPLKSTVTISLGPQRRWNRRNRPKSPESRVIADIARHRLTRQSLIRRPGRIKPAA